MSYLRVWKIFEEAHLPEYGSEWAACFDLKASLRDGDEVTVYTQQNRKDKRKVIGKRITIFSGERALVPTGLVFDLSQDESLRIHPRSGLSLKNGIIIANCEGVVDPDYVQQSYVMLYNVSDMLFDVDDGMRIAQGEIVPMNQPSIILADALPNSKTNRTGGFGSTGVN